MQKYKVFLNEKRIFFRSYTKRTNKKKSGAYPALPNGAEVEKWLAQINDAETAEFIFESANPEQQFNNFRAAFMAIDAAGGMVSRNGKFLFIFRNGKWDLPKGKIEKGESPGQAALREVEEECGVFDLKIVKELSPTYHIYQSPYEDTLGQWVLKKTFWYEMEYNGSEEGTPQFEEGITEVRWLEKKETGEVLKNTYENLKELIRNQLDVSPRRLRSFI